MAYVALSQYEYCTGDELEAFADVVYTTLVDPIIEVNVMAIVSQGEREINTKTGQTFTGTIPDAVKTVAIELAYRRLYNRMVWIGLMDRENPKKRLKPVWDDSLMGLLKVFISKNVSPIRLHHLYDNERS